MQKNETGITENDPAEALVECW